MYSNSSMSMHLLLDHLSFFMQQQPRCSAARLSTDVFETKHKHSRLFRVSGSLKHGHPTFYQLLLKSTAVFTHELSSGGACVKAVVKAQVKAQVGRRAVTLRRQECLQLATAAISSTRTTNHVIKIDDEQCSVMIE
jgi:hypothetical protein